MLALFLFERGGDRIVCERVYFDTESIRRQLLDNAEAIAQPLRAQADVAAGDYVTGDELRAKYPSR